MADFTKLYNAFRASKEKPNFRQNYEGFYGGTFQRSLDGDTADLSRGNLRTPTRFAGIDAPESSQGEIGQEAHKFLDKLIGDERNIRVGSKARDRYGRDVSVMYAGDKNLNVEMVRNGYAKVYHDYLDGLSPDLKQKFIDAELEAQNKGVGIWALDDYVDAADYRKQGNFQSSAGHDNRSPIDEKTKYMMDMFREYQNKTGRSFPKATNSVPSFTNYVKREDQYAPEESWLEKVLGGLDYAGNISRSAIKGVATAKDGEGLSQGFKFAKQAANKDRYTDPSDLKDLATESLGLGKVRLGKDDGSFQIGDVGDFALNLGIDIATDPLTALSLGWSSVAKGGKLSKVFSNMNIGAMEAKAGLKTPAALDYVKAETAARGAIGATYGYGIADGEDPLGKKLLYAGTGAALGTKSKKLFEGGGKLFKSGFNKASDWYMASSRGDSKFTNFSVAKDVANEAFSKTKNLAEWIRQGRHEALDGLTDVEKLKVSDIMEKAKTETLARRHKYEKKIKARKGTAEYDRQFNEMMKKINHDVEYAFLPNLLNNEADNIVKSVAAWGRHNERVVERLNKEVFGISKADSSFSNAGKVYASGKYIRDPNNGRLYKDADFQKRYSKEQIAEMENLDVLDFGAFAAKDIKLKDGSVIKQGTKFNNYDFKQFGDGKDVSYAKRQLQDGTYLGNDDIVYRTKDFQPFDPKSFDGGKGIVGLKWHIDDVYKRFDVDDDLAKVDEAFEGVNIFKADSLSRSKAGEIIAKDMYAKKFGKQLSDKEMNILINRQDPDFLKMLSEGRDKSYGVYAESFANKFLDTKQKEAINLVREYAESMPTSKGLARVEKALDGFDKVSNFMKANMLYFSMSWLKNNYFDNFAKSYVENGLAGLVDGITVGKLRKGLYEDVKGLYSNTLKKAKTEELQEAMELGVLDNPMFKSMMDESTRRFLYTPDQISEAMKVTDVKSGVKKLSQMVLNNPYSKAIAGIGSNIEGTARMMTYLRTKDVLSKSKAFSGKEGAEQAKRVAADLTKKTFFDYGDVTHFENAVFKRLIPFYSFYSKNLPYWINATVSPETAGRIQNIEKTRRNIGEDPDSYEKSGLSQYMLDQAPRKFGKDDKGNTVYGIVPSLSFHDAVSMINPSEWVGQVQAKGNPLLKAPVEVATGHDYFTGTPLFPSDEKQQKKFLFSRGFTQYGVKRGLEMLGFDAESFVQEALGVSGVDVDDRGNPFTKKDSDMVIDKIFTSIFPRGIVDQLAGSIGKTIFDKEDLDEALANRLLPIQRVKVSPDFSRMVRQNKRKEKGGE